MLNIAIVGTGNISKAHVAAWQNIPEAKLVAVCDIRPEMADPVAEATGAKAYYSYDDMLANEKIDILDICLPTYLHPDFALRAMEKGIHVLTEKPISLVEGDVQPLYDAAAKNDVRFMVAQVLRFWHEFELLKEAFETEKYGKLLSGNMYRLGHTPKWSWDNWMTDPARSGLVPFDLHIHDLDFMIYTFGKPEGVECARARNDRQDYIHAVYNYGDYFIVCEAAWYDCEYAFRSGYRFQFEKAVMEYSGRLLTIYHQDGTKEEIGGETITVGGVSIPTTNAYYNEIRYFTDRVLAGENCDRVKAEELKTVLDCIAKLDV